jgi:hypothetical protein
MQAEELSRLQRRVAFLESSLQKERVRGSDLEETLSAAEAARADAAARCEAYEGGLYGLPQVGKGRGCLVSDSHCQTGLERQQVSIPFMHCATER